MVDDSDTRVTLNAELVWLRERVAALEGKQTALLEARAEAERRAAELAALNRIAAAVVSGRSVQEISGFVAQELHSFLAPDFVVFYTVDAGRLVLGPILRASLEDDDSIQMPREIKLGVCLCGIAAQSGSPIYSVDIHADPRCTLDECKNSGVRSFAALPLSTNSETVGVLGLASCAERDFSVEGPFLETIAAQTAMGLHKASYYESGLRHAADVERELLADVAMLEAILEKAADGICMCHHISEEPFVRFTHWNSRMTEITGYTMAEINRLGWYQTLYPDPDEQKRAVERMARACEGDDIAREEWTITTRDGEHKPLSISTSVLKDESGVVHVLALMRDVTEEKKARALQLQTARYRAVADLADGVAHTFNNLLQIILGNASFGLMNLEAGEYADVRERFGQIVQGSRLGAETVRRLRSFVGADEEAQEKGEEVFDLTDVVRHAREMTRVWWETNPQKEGLKVSLTLNLKQGCFVRGKKNDIFQVLANLIKNAAEALIESGEIWIDARPEGERVILKVSDTGVGISDDNLSRIFTPFFTTNPEPGRGIGLPICRTIIHNLGGTIEVQSSKGKGTNVIVNLPLARGVHQPLQPFTETPEPEGLSVVVIDDVEELAKMTSRVLQKDNHSVLTAFSGSEGLEFIRQSQTDAVICDLGMPGMDGWEVGKRVKELFAHRESPKPYFILLADWGRGNAPAEKMRDCGVDMVMEKPVDIPQLVGIITRLARNRKPQTTAGGPTA